MDSAVLNCSGLQLIHKTGAVGLVVFTLLSPFPTPNSLQFLSKVYTSMWLPSVGETLPQFNYVHLFMVNCYLATCTRCCLRIICTFKVIVGLYNILQQLIHGTYGLTGPCTMNLTHTSKCTFAQELWITVMLMVL